MYWDTIADLLHHPRVIETRYHMHHSVPKHDHLLRSVHFSYYLALFFGADQVTCVRAALLHDLDSRYGTLTTHGAIAARVAAELGESEAVSAAIISHMYPFGPRPTTREGWVLAVADKLASLADLGAFVSGLLSGHSLRVRRQLRQSDPFYAARYARRRHRRLMNSLWRRFGRNDGSRWRFGDQAQQV
ncbi:HD domain-containing protein [Chloroflexus aggregans]|uniref:Metal dependent phosphohydrolase n=1 Tax=Chloroflexus aggregans (strain MD-66 / DSM 9485) TaxID=326427 RepID=B8G539_CHLAD|nr:HD domain-containing protein [Chloroflexus aggregans]ACL23672.1 metal dependent phosphohydrolase [Chloroflexus aggregans DSM 9485]